MIKIKPLLIEVDETSGCSEMLLCFRANLAHFLRVVALKQNENVQGSPMLVEWEGNLK